MNKTPGNVLGVIFTPNKRKGKAMRNKYTDPTAPRLRVWRPEVDNRLGQKLATAMLQSVERQLAEFRRLKRKGDAAQRKAAKEAIARHQQAQAFWTTKLERLRKKAA
jgi:hypothetical protein